MDADALTEAWAARWPGCPPIADRLRSHDPERWVRFHSLPGSKRYAEDDEERATVLARHHAVLSALGAAPTTPVLSVTREFSDSRSTPSRDGDLERAQPGAWPWRAIQDPDDDGWTEEVWWHLHVAPTSVAELDPLLTLAADDRTEGVMVLPLDLAWAHHPYDGGMDVLLPTTADRDALRDRFSAWLSPHPHGL